MRPVLRKDDKDRGYNVANEKEAMSSRARKRITELMTSFDEEPSDAQKNVIFRFLAAPHEIMVTKEGENAIENELVGMVVERTALDGEAHSQTLRRTGELETIPCQLILLSIGYAVEPIEDLPLDPSKSRVQNIEGRVEGKSGVYVTGWLKRGPSGIIGTNIPDAKETATSILEDKHKLKGVDRDEVEKLFANIVTVNWNEYLKIENEETERGKQRNPSTPRQKILCVEEQLHLAHNP